MIEAASKIAAYVQDATELIFLTDSKLHDAVSLNLLVIGEGARQLSEARRGAAPEVPWTEMIGLRHRLAHGYGRIDLRIVWRIATVDAPRIVPQLQAVLALLPPA